MKKMQKVRKGDKKGGGAESEPKPGRPGCNEVRDEWASGAGPGSGGMSVESKVARPPTLDGVKLSQPELSTTDSSVGLGGAPFLRFSRVVWNGESWISSLGGVM